MSQNVPSGEGGGRQPIFLVPGGVAALAGLLVAIHVSAGLVLDVHGLGNLRIWFGFIPFRLSAPDLLPGGYLPLLWTGFTHALLHVDAMHLIVNTAWLVVFGTPVARRYGKGRFFAVFFLGALAGAVLLAVIQLAFVNQFSVLIGASGGVAALTGAAMRFIFQPVVVGEDPTTGERVILGRQTATLGQLFTDPRSRAFIIVWIGLNLLIPLAPLFLDVQIPIAWEAHIGGFVAGLLMPSLFDARARRYRG
ncbi:rhomboid family intramembrane serine protease [Pelagibacterium limicola]|uniref:rhomboid family intramembrane serine protease n=1 Tax=Pelagibacterium limicola TaxID=2791022 RepID=UPI0018B00271|nr:rhomboid family intramembrane serine protease [Pelagibacterium limicola]